MHNMQLYVIIMHLCWIRKAFSARHQGTSSIPLHPGHNDRAADIDIDIDFVIDIDFIIDIDIDFIVDINIDFIIDIDILIY